MNKLCILLSAAALVVSAAAAVPAGAQTALPTPDPQTVWAFFEALPDADLPAGINTRAERVQFHQDYDAQVVEIDEEQEEDIDYYYGDYVEQITNQIFWNPTILDPAWMEDVAEDLTEENGPMPTCELAVFPGTDKDRIFGLLEVFEYNNADGYKKLAEHGYWYSVSKKTVTPVALPLDVPYTDEDITEDGLLFFNQNELYWTMRDRRMEWFEEPDRITILLNGIGASTVSYVWNGTKFVRDRSYNPLTVYGGGIGTIDFGDEMPFGIHGYSSEWLETGQEYVRAWQYIKEGEEEPRFILYAYGDGRSTVDAIEILYPNYKLLEKIHVGMSASEAMRIFKEYYSWDEEARDPYVSDFDGKAWIFSGSDDPFQLGVDLKYYKNGKLSPDAKIAVIKIAPAVG